MSFNMSMIQTCYDELAHPGWTQEASSVTINEDCTQGVLCAGFTNWAENNRIIELAKIQAMKTMTDGSLSSLSPAQQAAKMKAIENLMKYTPTGDITITAATREAIAKRQVVRKRIGKPRKTNSCQASPTKVSKKPKHASKKQSSVVSTSALANSTIDFDAYLAMQSYESGAPFEIQSCADLPDTVWSGLEAVTPALYQLNQPPVGDHAELPSAAMHKDEFDIEDPCWDALTSAINGPMNFDGHSVMKSDTAITELEAWLPNLDFAGVAPAPSMTLGIPDFADFADFGAAGITPAPLEMSPGVANITDAPLSMTLGVANLSDLDFTGITPAHSSMSLGMTDFSVLDPDLTFAWDRDFASDSGLLVEPAYEPLPIEIDGVWFDPKEDAWAFA